MYKILLVDDEKLELNAIAHYIRWEDMGIVVAGTAKNGRDALKVMEACKPDIILTDVRMPIMNGLEFASKAKQLDKNVKIVFLSGHDEFQYIKAALTIEAMGYLLKPVDAAELAQLMQRVILKCQEDKQLSESSEATKEKLVRSLAAEQDEEMRREWVRRIGMLPHPLPTIGRYRVGVCSLDALDPAVWEASAGTAGSAGLNGTVGGSLPGGGTGAAAHAAPAGRHREAILSLTAGKLAGMQAPAYVWPLDEQRFCTLSYLYDDAEDEGLEALMEEIVEETGNRFGVVLSVGISRLGRYLEELPDRFGEAREANGDKFYSGAGRVIRYAAHAPAAPGSALHAMDVAEQLNHAVSHLRSAEAEAVLGAYFRHFAMNRTSRDAIIAGTMQVISEIERRYAPLLENRASGGASPLAIDWKTITEPESVGQLHAYLLSWTGGIMAVIREKDQDRNLNVVHQITALIHERYGEALTVDDLAERVYLTPNYIRTLFKQKTGETILEYLTKVRIGQASELLKDRSLKIHEVARAAGYENVSYFCSLFQKHKGVTPNEYRKKYL
ncbi:response regulator transcription factor [Paenibacillus sacheonensis]|uniref:Response regulator n=1 Tax=Paenibacillus sacheonensis TaxID=742054 RepID=A0A7X5BVZ7_9BACL|nr:response regulator [Paenibacillus sacheonensis]MBM7565780.1 two-component system response regulator YesN [Paenibacillus sacheonensis]NBC68898.1 response regulator [Paenibacillus sacheonensis]